MTATQTIEKRAIDTPAPASGETPDTVRVWLRFVRLQQRLSNGIAAELRAIGLSIPQFDLISTLSEREGITQGELAQRLYVTKGNVSGLVDRLVEAALVERRPIPGDRRSHALHLTPAGRQRAKDGIAAQRGFVERTLGRLPGEDVAELERILRAWRDVARETF
ncbi:MarR family winged helix-turn-helix transcriptional regulator [Salinarimonas rosea]|uniref:MarR family winged helix-turn-helix transcriptional regulator n=1 Tax=Salinarimonas rosea TaxID=552063 RepID=UPI0003FB3C24|nr:MarR family transcriptional regulator [Salinarimonas rosea]